MFSRKFYAVHHGRDPENHAYVPIHICRSKSEMKEWTRHTKQSHIKAFDSEYDAQIWCKLVADRDSHPNLSEPYDKFMGYAHAFSRTMGEVQCICKNNNITETQFIKIMESLGIIPGIHEIFQPNQQRYIH